MAAAAAKATACKEALSKWLAAQEGGKALEEVERVDLSGVCPPVEKMDSSLAALRACRHLSLSTNALDKIGNLAGLERLEVLSLGRNCLKKLENLEAVAGTLQQLWVSYNQIDRLVRPRPPRASCPPFRSESIPYRHTRALCRLAGRHRKVRPAARAVRQQQPAQGVGRGGAPGGAAAAGGPPARRQPAVQRVEG